MLKLNSQKKEVTSKRISSYGILKNKEGKIALVRHKDWGLILPGGKKEGKEIGDETIIRETLEEIGYKVQNLNYYETAEDFYDVITTHKKHYYCHNIADFYIGEIVYKVQEPIEEDTTLEWYDPKEAIGKMKLEFQNIILKKIFASENQECDFL